MMRIITKPLHRRGSSAGCQRSKFLSAVPASLGLGCLLLLGMVLTQAARAQVVETNWTQEAGAWANASGSNNGSDPSRIMDNNTSGNWADGSVWHSDSDQQPWCEVGLAAAHPVGRVVAWFRTDCCPERASGWDVVIKDVSQVELARVRLPNPFQTSTNAWAAANFAPAIPNAYYIRLEQTGVNWGNIAELQAFAPYTGVTFTVTQQPTNTTGLEGHTATIGPVAATVVGAPQNKLTFQWQRNGVDISGASGSTYTTPLLSRTNSGDAYTVKFLVSGLSTLSTSATLTVTPDVTPPTLVSAGSLNTTSIDVVFSELMDKASAETTSHYTVVGGTVTAATNLADMVTVKLTISGLSGSTFSVTALGVKDWAGNPCASVTKTGIIQGLTETTVQGGNTVIGSVVVPTPNEFDVIGGGDDVWGATSTFEYLSKPQSGDFDYMVQVYQLGNSGSGANSLIFRANLLAQSAGAQVRSMGNELGTPIGAGNAGILFGVAPDTGNFNWPPGISDWTRNKTMIPPNQYLRLKRIGDQFWGFISSNSVSWQNIGSDKVVIANPGYIGLGTAGSTPTVYKNLTPFTYPNVIITFTPQPLAQTIVQSYPVTFTAGPVATSDGNALPPVELTYQWQRNGVNIAGATGTSYSISAVTMADNNVNFRCVVHVTGATVNSADAKLTVTAKTVGPQVAGASGVKPGMIGIKYDSLLDPTTATNKSNYSVAGGAVSSVNLGADGYSVALITTVAGATFDVTINNVKDAVGNTIAAGTHATGTFAAQTGVNVGAPETAGYALSSQSGKISLSAAGGARSNEGDNLYFVYDQVTGDFDKIVNLTSLSTTTPTTRAGIMARASLDSVSRLVELAVEGDVVSENHRIVFMGTNDAPGTGIPDYPSTTPANYFSQLGYGGVNANLVAQGGTGQWLRIRRTGQSFHYFVKSGANAWAQICSKHSPDMPKTMYVGCYVAANNATPAYPEAVGSASFEGWGDYVKTGDTVAPTMVSSGTKDKKVIGVKFSKDINGATVSAANFTVTQAVGGAVTVTGADTAMMGDGVYLTVTGLTSDSFTVTGSGVKDLAGNVMVASSTVTGKTSGIKSFDLGVYVDPAVRPQATDDPYVIGTSIPLSSGDLTDIDFVGGGYNNGVGTPDASHVVYTEVTGDFDYMCTIIRYDKSDNIGGWANGGLTVYAGTNSTKKLDGTDIPPNTDDAASIPRFSSIGYCQNAQNGSKSYHTWKDAPASGQGDGGPQAGNGTPDSNGITGRWSRYLNVQNASGTLVAGYNPAVEDWHRLKRVGTKVSDYWSVDGVTWMAGVVDHISANIPSKCLVGFQYATDAGSHKGQTAAHFVAVGIRNFGPTVLVGPQPTMTVAFVSGTIVVSWPTSAAGYVLQGTTSLSPSNWLPATDLTPMQVGNEWTVTIQPGTGIRYFRLAK